VGFESDDFNVVLTPALFDPATLVNNGSKTLTAFNAAGLSVAPSNANSFDLVSFELGGSFLADPSAWAGLRSFELIPAAPPAPTASARTSASTTS
jgi:hypothetical protein